jgi:hypothetical protein
LRSLFVTAAHKKYASFLTLSHAVHPGIFEQPAKNDFFNSLLIFDAEQAIRPGAQPPERGIGSLCTHYTRSDRV